MKLAVIFPGIGYRFNKPLLYYSSRLAKFYNYEIIECGYDKFLNNIRGNEDKINKSIELSFHQCEEILKDVDFNKYDDVLFISKSIGTVISAKYSNTYNIKCKNLYYTPLKQTFDYDLHGIVFHGTSDPWANTDIILSLCKKYNITYYVYDNCNHSLECDDILRNIDILKDVMNISAQYMK